MLEFGFENWYFFNQINDCLNLVLKIDILLSSKFMFKFDLENQEFFVFFERVPEVQ
jgi:hypothetical protein